MINPKLRLSWAKGFKCGIGCDLSTLIRSRRGNSTCWLWTASLMQNLMATFSCDSPWICDSKSRSLWTATWRTPGNAFHSRLTVSTLQTGLAATEELGFEGMGARELDCQLGFWSWIPKLAAKKIDGFSSHAMGWKSSKVFQIFQFVFQFGYQMKKGVLFRRWFKTQTQLDSMNLYMN